MKTLVFIIVVLASAYYLASQTNSGKAFIAKHLPQQQIKQASDELLKQVDTRLQDFAQQNNHTQQLQIEQLSHRLDDLESQLKQQNLVAQQNATKLEQINTPALPIPSHSIEPAPVEPTQKAAVQTALAAPIPRQSLNDDKNLKFQKQASLQDIASRMELVSLQISLGTQ